jgi:ABC-type multidrug transport system fused ATPase/permease subunit
MLPACSQLFTSQRNILLIRCRALVYTAILSLVGCIIIAFIFGWKLTVLTVFVAMPIILAAGFFRIRYEIQFESMNQAVFAESSKFAAESIGAFRTVSSLTLEDIICRRYEVLLQGHVTAAFHKSKYSSLVFAASDSVQLLAMALAFWYGGQLLGKGEYSPLQFFVVYMAVINGAEGAGTFLSFGPSKCSHVLNDREFLLTIGIRYGSSFSRG